MFVITREDDVIMHIAQTKGYQSNGNILLDEGMLSAVAIPPQLIKSIYEVEEIPDGVKTEKYCYTEEKGFYENVDYIEPINEKTEIEKLRAQSESLQEQVTNLELALAEIYENGGN